MDIDPVLAGLGAWDALADPWREAIVQRAFAEVLLLAVVGGALGCWISFYELSYTTESLAHAIFPGLVVATLAGFPVVLGGAAGLVVAALTIALAGRTAEIGSDTAVAVVVPGFLGLGALLALSAATPPGLDGLLFGDILGVSDLDLWLSVALAAVTVIALALLHRQLLAVGFDRTSAHALGGLPALVDIALLVLVALAVVVGVQGLGALLVTAVLIGPAATARLVTHRMVPMMALATVLALLAGGGGLYLSYYADTAGGASIAAVIVVSYLAVRATTFVRTAPAFATERRAVWLPRSRTRS
jgi:ABC-type Mn2+/Zn2+ transport system permease subunit